MVFCSAGSWLPAAPVPGQSPYAMPPIILGSFEVQADRMAVKSIGMICVLMPTASQ
jgi:hypothetical protein